MSDRHNAAREVPFRSPKDDGPADGNAYEAALEATAEIRRGKDYTGWITVQELADRLGGIRRDLCYQLVRKHVAHDKVLGRVLISPEAAAAYEIKYHYTRRTRPPQSGS